MVRAGACVGMLSRKLNVRCKGLGRWNFGGSVYPRVTRGPIAASLLQPRHANPPPPPSRLPRPWCWCSSPSPAWRPSASASTSSSPRSTRRCVCRNLRACVRSCKRARGALLLRLRRKRRDAARLGVASALVCTAIASCWQSPAVRRVYVVTAAGIELHNAPCMMHPTCMRETLYPSLPHMALAPPGDVQDGCHHGRRHPGRGRPQLHRGAALTLGLLPPHLGGGPGRVHAVLVGAGWR